MWYSSLMHNVAYVDGATFVDDFIAFSHCDFHIVMHDKRW